MFVQMCLSLGPDFDQFLIIFDDFRGEMFLSSIFLSCVFGVYRISVPGSRYVFSSIPADVAMLTAAAIQTAMAAWKTAAVWTAAAVAPAAFRPDTGGGVEVTVV